MDRLPRLRVQLLQFRPAYRRPGVQARAPLTRRVSTRSVICSGRWRQQGGGDAHEHCEASASSPRRQQHANQGDPWRHARCGGNRWSGDQRGSGRFGERRPIHLRARRAIRFRNDHAGCARSAGERASGKRPRPRRPEIPYRDGVRRRKPRQGEDRERAALRVGARNSGTLPRRDQGGGARPPARSARGHDPLQHGEHHWAALGRRRREQMAAAL